MSQANPNRRGGQSALDAYRNLNREPTRLRRDDFTLANGVAGQRSNVAEFKAPFPFEVREDLPFRLTLVTHEGFFHTGATTAEQTYTLANDAIETPNTTDIQVFADSTELTRVDSAPANGEYTFDAANDQITVDQNTDVTLHVYYHARDGLLLEVVKEKPTTTGAVDEVLYDDITTDLFERNQNSQPPSFTFNQSGYEQIVPVDWKLVVYTDGSAYNIEWDDSDTDTSGSKTVNNTATTIPVIDIPIRMAPGEVKGLGREVSRDIGNRR